MLRVSSAAVPIVGQLGADPMSPLSGGFGARSRCGATASFVSMQTLGLELSVEPLEAFSFWAKGAAPTGLVSCLQQR